MILHHGEERPVAKIVYRLEEARKLVNQSVILVTNIDGFDQKNYLGSAGTALSFISEMICDLYDLDPTVVPDELRPTLAPVDLKDTLELLKSTNINIAKTAMESMKQHMPKSIIDILSSKTVFSDMYYIATMWWRSQPIPYIPIYKTARHLTHKRLFIRFHSAKAIEKEYNITLWDTQTGNIDTSAVNAWLEYENIDI